MMKIGQRIRQLRKSKGLTLSDLEQAAGLADGNLSRIERGLQWMTEDTMRELARALRVNPSEFFEESNLIILDEAHDAPSVDHIRPYGQLPLISDVQAGEWTEAVDNFHPGDAEEWLYCPFKHGPNSFVLRVSGYSMYNPGGEKSYAPGEFIAVDPSREAVNKSMVIARVDHEDKTTFKQLLVDGEGSYMLQALNPSHSPRLLSMPEGSRIIGVVIGKWVPE